MKDCILQIFVTILFAIVAMVMVEKVGFEIEVIVILALIYVKMILNDLKGD